AALFSRTGESRRYFKRKPFGGETQMHVAGSQAIAVPLDGRLIGLNICFDSCFPSVMRDTARLGARVIVLPSMGPETPYGWIQAIHGAYTPFRSAELGIPIGRAEVTAFAMITDSSGRIVAQAPPGYRGPLVATVE